MDVDVFTIVSQRLLATVWPWLSPARREDGQTFVEYALILAVIAVGTAAALTVLSNQISALYASIIADVPFN
jgi:Flp pilus assembly pilin Flp